MKQARDPRAVYQQAVAALNHGDWQTAYRAAMSLFPQAAAHGGVHFVAGVAALQMRDMGRALAHLQEAVKLSPERADYGAQLARALAQARMLRQAVEVAGAAARHATDDPLTLDTLGVVLTQGNAHAQACELFSRASKRMPNHASYRFNLATSLTFVGRLDEAEGEYEACLRLEPTYWKAHLALAQLRKLTPQHHHLARLRGLLETHGTDAQARMYLNLAMAKELEDLGEYPTAFVHLSAGKRAGAEGRGYGIARDAEVFRSLERAFDSAGNAGSGDDSREPIFIIGMPRSGTTLLDRMLSSHPSVHSAGELENFGVLLKRASGSRTPSLLDTDTIDRAMNCDWTKLGRAYVDSTRPGTGHTPHFVDKLPHNFLYAGFIARALPNVRIICMRRGPLDTCLGNFRQLFAQTSPYYDYSFDILDCGHYWQLFDRLMRHWQTLMPGRILEVDYEDLVTNPRENVARVLAHCGLEWNEACLQFHDNTAPVATASAVQVREPLNTKSIGRWRRYENELQPLIELLGDAAH